MSEKPKALKTVRRTFEYLFSKAWRIHKAYFIIGILRTIISALIPFVTIIASPILIDELLGERRLSILITCALIIVLGDCLLSLVESVLGVTMEKYQEKFNSYFLEEISRRSMEIDFQLTENKKALDQIDAARTGMSWYSGGVNGIASQFFNMVASILSLLGVSTLIALNAPILFILIVILLIINTLINAKINKIDIEQFAKLSKHNRIFGYLSYHLVDFRLGKDIRLYDAKAMMLEKWNTYTQRTLSDSRNGANKQLPLRMLAVLVDVARDFGSYLYVGFLAIMGKITIGVFTQMMQCCSTFYFSLQGIITNVQEILKRCGYAYEYVKFMEYPAAIEKGSRHVADTAHTIEFRNVHFSYPDTDVVVLNGISVTLKPGEHLSVVGLNGAGKTTFIKLLCRLYDPTEGEILLDGINIKEYDYAEYMALFAPVFQDFKLFSFSIADNITVGADGDIGQIVKQVGLEDKIASLPNGTDTMLFRTFVEDGIEPSGGEQQKLAIARALFKKSPFVILDEPTAALDPIAEYDIYRQFHELVGNKTAVYISHRLSSCRFCDRIAVFSDGIIKEYGTHDELVGIDGGVYAEMFAAQAHYYK